MLLLKIDTIVWLPWKSCVFVRRKAATFFNTNQFSGVYLTTSVHLICISSLCCCFFTKSAFNALTVFCEIMNSIMKRRWNNNIRVNGHAWLVVEWMKRKNDSLFYRKKDSHEPEMRTEENWRKSFGLFFIICKRNPPSFWFYTNKKSSKVL